MLVAPLSTCVPGGGFIPSLLFNKKKTFRLKNKKKLFQLRTPFNWLLINLSATDLVISLVGNPVLAYNSFYKTWRLSATACQLNAFGMTFLGGTDNAYLVDNSAKPGKCSSIIETLIISIVHSVHWLLILYFCIYMVLWTLADNIFHVEILGNSL